MKPYTEHDQKWLAYALTLAKKAEQYNEVPVGAVIVLDNEVVGEGWNQPISANDPTAHAEIIALRQAASALNNYRLLNTTMYVTLEPCLMCAGALIHARVQKLIFGAQDAKAGSVKTFDDPKVNHNVLWQGGLFQEECKHLLQNFFKKRR